MTSHRLNTVAFISVLYIHLGSSQSILDRVYGRLHGSFGPRREKACLRRFANNKAAYQPAHPRSLISAFVIRLLERIISRLATGDISSF